MIRLLFTCTCLLASHLTPTSFAIPTTAPSVVIPTAMVNYAVTSLRGIHYPVATVQPTTAPTRRSSAPSTTARPVRRRSVPVTTLLDPNTTEPAGMHYHTFTSATLNAEASYLIYLPPGYETEINRRYPVVYWLHGRGGNQRGAGKVALYFDQAIRAGKMPPVILVGVNGTSFSSYVDRADGTLPAQSVIVKDLVPHIDATYRTIGTRASRGIEGFSMGGAGTAKIGFRYPETFGVVSVLAGALHDLEDYRVLHGGAAFRDTYNSSDTYFQENNPWEIVRKNAGLIRGRTVVRVVVGGADPLLDKNTRFHELLDELGITNDFTVIPNIGHHGDRIYAELGDHTAEFYTRAFGSLASNRIGSDSR